MLIKEYYVHKRIYYVNKGNFYANWMLGYNSNKQWNKTYMEAIKSLEIVIKSLRILLEITIRKISRQEGGFLKFSLAINGSWFIIKEKCTPLAKIVLLPLGLTSAIERQIWKIALIISKRKILQKCQITWRIRITYRRH